MSWNFGEFRRPRRYYLAHRILSSFTQDGFYGVWKFKQEAEPGSVLPATFPSKSALSDAGYTTAEDIDGADAAEIQANVGLTADQAQAVLTAVIPLI